ncbi:hypothetical protein GH733_009213 [Mirounga leonina]|nr:hypothetical protein GH733_009213 [Mirounga leonina]
MAWVRGRSKEPVCCKSTVVLVIVSENAGSVIMNGSSVANTSPNVKSKEDQGLNGHDEKENPFAEYMWMENEEDFNRQDTYIDDIIFYWFAKKCSLYLSKVLKVFFSFRGLITRKEGQKLRVGFDLISTIQVEEELQEQDFLDRCFQEMLDEEDQDWFIPSRDLPQAMGQLQQQLNGLSVSGGHESEDILVLDVHKRVDNQRDYSEVENKGMVVTKPLWWNTRIFIELRYSVN